MGSTSPHGCQAALLTLNLHSTVIFLLFETADQVERFKTYMNTCHKNMKFTSETEVDDILPFLDIKVIRTASSFVTSVYRKPTFSGVYTNYNSFLPQTYKSGLIRTLLFRLYTICSDWNMVHKEIEHLKSVMKRSAYPERLTLPSVSRPPLHETRCLPTATGWPDIPAFSAISRYFVGENRKINQQGVQTIPA